MNTITNQLPRLCASLVLCLIPFLLSAQTQYTLEECIEMALQNNVRIKNAANNLQAATLTKESAFTQYFPSISATGTGFIADKAFVQMDVAPGQNISLLKDGIIGGITAVQPLFAGGQIVQANKLAKLTHCKIRSIILHKFNHYEKPHENNSVHCGVFAVLSSPSPRI